MKLGIFMGSFDPPHHGHINIVRFLLEKKFVDKVLIIPTTNYWDKNNLTPLKHRLKMLKYFEDEHILIDEKHNQYVKTYELLEKLKECYPNDTLYPIIGADNLVSFDKWYNYKKILAYHIIVVPRKDIDSYYYIDKLKGPFLLMEDFPMTDISSTEIKKNLESKYLDERVQNYIKKHHLYKGEL